MLGGLALLVSYAVWNLLDESVALMLYRSFGGTLLGRYETLVSIILLSPIPLVIWAMLVRAYLAVSWRRLATELRDTADPSKYNEAIRLTDSAEATFQRCARAIRGLQLRLALAQPNQLLIAVRLPILPLSTFGEIVQLSVAAEAERSQVVVSSTPIFPGTIFAGRQQQRNVQSVMAAIVTSALG